MKNSSFFQRHNKITLSVTPSASQKGLIPSFAWFKSSDANTHKIRGLQTKNLLITYVFILWHPLLLSCLKASAHWASTSYPSSTYNSCLHRWFIGPVTFIIELIWIKYLTTLGETNWGVFYGLMTLDQSAAPQHKPTGTCTGTRRTEQHDWEHIMGVTMVVSKLLWHKMTASAAADMVTLG